MKVKFLLLVAVLTTIFTSCQNTDEPKEISKPGANGNYLVVFRISKQPKITRNIQA